jgi:hypothetical protein
MMIHVIFENRRHGYIEASRFDDLIATFPIASFRRRDKWIRVGIDPIRSMTADSLARPKGEERRYSYRTLKKKHKATVAAADILAPSLRQLL